MSQSESNHSNKDWNREILNQRFSSTPEKDERRELTDAEFHLSVGRIVQNWLIRGLNVKAYSDQVNMSEIQCSMALAYANSSPGLIFRALMEDWSWVRIQQEIKKDQSIQAG